jgi:transposase InsO family protein
LAVEVRRLFAVHRGTYGSPRITADLRDEGWVVSVNTVAGLMAGLGLASRRPRRRRQTTRRGKGRWRAPDLIRRQFGAGELNCKWYGDGTEVVTGEGKLFLDSVLDMGSRRIVGFALGKHHDAGLAVAALRMAVAVRGGRARVAGVKFHSDQGSEYTSDAFRRACARMGVTQSMGRVGSALDNAVIESWHSTLEFELRSLKCFPTKAAACRAVVEWIEDYNHFRRHSALHMLSPIAYERALARQQQQEKRGQQDQVAHNPAQVGAA